jgi:hypothetical protein
MSLDSMKPIRTTTMMIANLAVMAGIVLMAGFMIHTTPTLTVGEAGTAVHQMVITDHPDDTVQEVLQEEEGETDMTHQEVITRNHDPWYPFSRPNLTNEITGL